MLQISQTENPICSATIDQIRLRRATTLPLEFQNVSSSGFQSEIQLGSCLLIRYFLSTVIRIARRHGGALRGGPGSAVSQIRMSGFRRTATMASAQAFQASCQAAALKK